MKKEKNKKKDFSFIILLLLLFLNLVTIYSRDRPICAVMHHLI